MTVQVQLDDTLIVYSHASDATRPSIILGNPGAKNSVASRINGKKLDKFFGKWSPWAPGLLQTAEYPYIHSTSPLLTALVDIRIFRGQWDIFPHGVSERLAEVLENWHK